jgi:hypothetical protein
MNVNPPVCSCRNEGKPWEQDGETYVSRDPSCRVHEMKYKPPYPPLSAETIVGNWQSKEKAK